jgi:hypothetical protein
LEDLRHRDMTLEVDGGHLHVDAPAVAITDELRAALVENRRSVGIPGLGAAHARKDQQTRGGNCEVYIMDADSSRQRRLTRTPDDEFFLAWSPDGERIAYTTNPSYDPMIWVMGADMDRERESNRRGDPERERKAWLDKLAETDRMRGNYQEQTAKGLVTIDELAARLEELEGTRRAAERELTIFSDHWENIERMERDKDLLLDPYTAMAPEALSSLTPEERHQVYKMLRLKVIAHLDGDVELAGDLVCILGGGEGKEGNMIEKSSSVETTP